MLKVGVVGCTGKLGGMVIKDAVERPEIEIAYAIARQGNQYVGHNVSELVGKPLDLVVIDDVEKAVNCDVFFDCTNANAFVHTNLEKYINMGKPVVIATTAFTDQDMLKILQLASAVPVFQTANFSVTLHNFIESLKFTASRITNDTDIQIIEYHHNEKKDAPSGTSRMIRDALVAANPSLKAEDIDIFSVRGGNLFGEHEVIFANSKDEVVTFKHSVSSRKPFSQGALDVMSWLVKQPNGLYGMDDYCR